MSKEELLEVEAVLFTGWDDAIVGVTDEGQAVYSYDLILETLKERDGLTDEEAQDWIEYNLYKTMPYIADEGKQPVIMHLIEG